MKRVLFLLLSAIMYLLLACGNSTDTQSTTGTQSTTVAQSQPQAEYDWSYAEDITLQINIIHERKAAFLLTGLAIDEDAPSKYWGVRMDADDDNFYECGLYINPDCVVCDVTLGNGNSRLGLSELAYWYDEDSLYFEVDTDDWAKYGNEVEGFNFYDFPCYTIYLVDKLDEYFFTLDKEDVLTDSIISQSASSFIWPNFSRRAELDVENFTPLGDDYAVLSDATSMHQIENFVLYDFDDYGNVVRVTERKLDVEYSDDEEATFVVGGYEDLTERIKEKMMYANWKSVSDKAYLMSTAMENYDYALFSKPSTVSVYFEGADLAEFQLMEYFTPPSDDYFAWERVVNYGNSDLMETLVISFHSDGTVMARNAIMQAAKSDGATSSSLVADGWNVIAETETHFIVLSDGEGYPYFVDKTKHTIMEQVINNIYSKTLTYEEMMSMYGEAYGFSNPTFTEEQQAFWIRANSTDVWEDILQFEEKYDDKITFHSDNVFGDGFTNPSDIVFALEDGKAVASYLVYSCREEESIYDLFLTLRGTFSNIYYDNFYVLDSHNEVYIIRSDFVYTSYDGMSKEELVYAHETSGLDISEVIYSGVDYLVDKKPFLPQLGYEYISYGQ